MLICGRLGAPLVYRSFGCFSLTLFHTNGSAKPLCSFFRFLIPPIRPSRRRCSVLNWKFSMPSRDMRRGGRLLSFEPGNISPGIRSVTGRPSLFSHPVPARPWDALLMSCPQRPWTDEWGCRVPPKELATVEGSVSKPAGVVVSADANEDKICQPAYLLVQALISSLWLVAVNDASDGSIGFNPVPPSPWPSLDATSRFRRLSRFVQRLPGVRFRQLRTERLLPPNVSVGSIG